MPCSLHCLFSLGIPGALVLLSCVVKPIWWEKQQYFSSFPQRRDSIPPLLHCECRIFLKSSTALIRVKLQQPFLIGNDHTLCCNLPIPWRQWSQISGYRWIDPSQNSWAATTWCFGGDHAISQVSALKRRPPGGDAPTNILHLPHHAHSHMGRHHAKTYARNLHGS